MRGIFLPSGIEAHCKDDGRDTGAAGGDDGLSVSTPPSLNAAAIVRRDETAVLDDFRGRHVERARHVTGPQARRVARGSVPGKAAGRTRIDDLGAFVVERHLHVADHRHSAGVHAGVEGALRRV